MGLLVSCRRAEEDSAAQWPRRYKPVPGHSVHNRYHLCGNLDNGYAATAFFIVSASMCCDHASKASRTSLASDGWWWCEWRLAPQWSAFLERNYIDFGSDDNIFVPVACPAGCKISPKTTVATVLVGVNYRFGPGL